MKNETMEILESQLNKMKETMEANYAQIEDYYAQIGEEIRALRLLYRSRKGKKEDPEDQSLNDKQLVETEVATEPISQLQVPVSKLEPSPRFHNASPDVCEDFKSLVGVAGLFDHVKARVVLLKKSAGVTINQVAHQLFDQMPSKEKQRKCLKAWKFKFKTTSKRSKLMGDRFSFVEETALLNKDPKETIWDCVKKEFKETMVAYGKTRVDRFKLVDKKESRPEVMDMNQTFLYHQIGHGVDTLLVLKRVVHDKEMALVRQRATSLMICDCSNRSSRANRVWKPGGLLFVQDHSGGSILMRTQQFHGLHLQRIIYMDMKFQEVIVVNVETGSKEHSHESFGSKGLAYDGCVILGMNFAGFERGEAELLATSHKMQRIDLFSFCCSCTNQILVAIHTGIEENLEFNQLLAAVERFSREVIEELAKRIVIEQKIEGGLICGDVKFHLKHKWRFRLLESFSRLELLALIILWFSQTYELSGLLKDSSNGGAESSPILNYATEQPLLWLQVNSEKYLIDSEFEKKKQMIGYKTWMFKYKAPIRRRQFLHHFDKEVPIETNWAVQRIWDKDSPDVGITDAYYVLQDKLEQVDENLKVVNLRGCHSLEEIPDLSSHQALEKLVFERCKLLVKVPTSVGNLKTLLQLDLRNCSNLSEFLIDVSGLKRLEKLFLSGCSNLGVLPENIGAMPCLKELLLDRTAIKKLPESIYRLENLEKLSLKGCRSIKELPLCVGTLTSLEELYLDDTALENLPNSIGYLKNLQKLHLMHCASLSKIPDTINELKSLKELFLYGSTVEELPLNPGSLPCLNDLSAGYCKSLKQVPSSIGGLNSLLQLQLDNTPIETLPEEISHLHFIRNLELRNCKSLKVLPESIGDMDTLESLHISGSNIEKLPDGFGKLENLVLLRMNNCKMLKRLPNSFGDLKSLHHLYMKETSVVELPESFGNLSNLMVLEMLKKPLFRSSGSEEPQFVEVPNSFSNLLALEELDARSWGISGKIPDDLEKLSSLKILNLGNNYFHSLPASLKGLASLKELLLYDCRELKCLPPLPCKLEKLNLANCFSLESISNLSELTVLHDLNLTNCAEVNDVPGLENLSALIRLYMSGCNSDCSFAVKKRLSKASMKLLWNLSLPGNRIPDWFSQGPLTFSAQPNRELRGVVLAVVVALNHETKDDYQLPDVMEVQAQILKLDQALYTHTLHLSGVPRTSNDQLHICRYSALHPMLMTLKDGYTIQVIKREPPIIQGVELKMHGIHLVYEGDDDFKGEEHLLTESQLTVSQKLANFFRSFDEGEASAETDQSSVT